MFQGIPFAPISDVRELPRAHSMGRPHPPTHTKSSVAGSLFNEGVASALCFLVGHFNRRLFTTVI